MEKKLQKNGDCNDLNAASICVESRRVLHPITNQPTNPLAPQSPTSHPYIQQHPHCLLTENYAKYLFLLDLANVNIPFFQSFAFSDRSPWQSLNFGPITPRTRRKHLIILRLSSDVSYLLNEPIHLAPCLMSMERGGKQLGYQGEGELLPRGFRGSHGEGAKRALKSYFSRRASILKCIRLASEGEKSLSQRYG